MSGSAGHSWLRCHCLSAAGARWNRCRRWSHHEPAASRLPATSSDIVRVRSGLILLRCRAKMFPHLGWVVVAVIGAHSLQPALAENGHSVCIAEIGGVRRLSAWSSVERPMSGPAFCAGNYMSSPMGGPWSSGGLTVGLRCMQPWSTLSSVGGFCSMIRTAAFA